METSKIGTLNTQNNEENDLFAKKNVFITTTKYSTDIAQYELISPIGGVDDISYLYLALYIPTNEFVALKYTDLTISVDFALIQELENTIVNTHLLKHPNILPYYTDFIENDRLWTVTYPMKAGACSTILKDYFPDGFSEMMASSILKEVLKAVYYLHSNNLVHNDIRASNILLDFNGDVKLTGYHQLSSLVVGGKLKKSIFTPIGDNHEWVAPEIIAQNTSHNHKSDIYSIGITALELVYNKTPFDEWPSAKILLSKIMYAIPMIKSEKRLSKNFWSFVSACIRKDPKERPDVIELLEMPFIKKAKSIHYIESILKKSGIINKHTAAIESMMQNMAEITEKARQAQCLNNERTKAYNEELKRQQIMAIFSSNYSFNIDGLETTEGNEMIEDKMDAEHSNSIGVMVDLEGDSSIDVDSRLQNQSYQTSKTDRISMHTSNSIISQNQQQSLFQSNNQQLVYTNPNSRTIPNSKSQTSSLKYISSHSLIKPGLQGQNQSGSHSSQQIKQSRLVGSKSNSMIMSKSEDSRSRILNSKSNSILMNNKNENESRSRMTRMNSKQSSISVISNSQIAFSKQGSQKIVGSEVFELVRDVSVTREKNSSYNIIKDNSGQHLIKEEDEEEVKALNNFINNSPVYVNYQISQPNIISKVPPLEPESKINNHSTPLLKEENGKPTNKKKMNKNTEGNRSSILAIGNRLSGIMVNSNSDIDNTRMKKSVSFTVSKNESVKEVNNDSINYDSMILKTSVLK